MSKTVPGSTLRVTRGITPRAGRAPRLAIATGHAGFVRRILARHAGRRSAMSALDRILRRPLMFVGPINHRHRRDYRLALRLNVRLERQYRIVEAARPFVSWRTTPMPAAPRPIVPIARRDLLERIVARERRLDSATTIQSIVERVTTTRERQRSVVLPAINFKPAPAVPMVTRRIAPAAPSGENPKPPQPPRSPFDDWTAAPARLRTQAAASPIPLTPAELGRLTDHVVNVIDRRFIAHRERQGRI